MALFRKSVVDQIESPRAGGCILVRFALLICDGDAEVDKRWHRTSIPFDVDPVVQLNAVNEDFLLNGQELLSQEDIDKVVAAYNFFKSQP